MIKFEIETITLSTTRTGLQAPVAGGPETISLPEIHSISRLILPVREGHKPNPTAVAAFNKMGQTSFLDAPSQIISGIEWDKLYWTLNALGAFFVETIEANGTDNLFLPVHAIERVQDCGNAGAILHFNDGRAPQRALVSDGVLLNRIEKAQKNLKLAPKEHFIHLAADLVSVRNGLPQCWKPACETRHPLPDPKIDAWERARSTPALPKAA